MEAQVDRRVASHRRPNHGAELLEAARVQARLQLAEEDLAALLGVGGHVDDVDVLAVGQAEVLVRVDQQADQVAQVGYGVTYDRNF